MLNNNFGLEIQFLDGQIPAVYGWFMLGTGNREWAVTAARAILANTTGVVVHVTDSNGELVEVTKQPEVNNDNS